MINKMEMINSLRRKQNQINRSKLAILTERFNSKPLSIKPQARQYQFKNCGCIGRGSFGIVWLVKYRNTNDKHKYSQLALKISFSSNKLHCMSETKILQRLQLIQYHSNIAKFYGYDFDERSNFRQIFEYYPYGTLQQFLNYQTKPLNSLQMLGILLQINDGLIHIHQNGIVHLDLKPNNLLIDVDKNNSLKILIADFGISTDL
eukprot:173929_1